MLLGMRSVEHLAHAIDDGGVLRDGLVRELLIAIRRSGDRSGAIAENFQHRGPRDDHSVYIHKLEFPKTKYGTG
jgi:hypothetical protein